MSTIANLDVNLFARTKKFDAPLKKSGTVFNGFSAGLSKGIKVLPPPALIAKAAIGGVVAVAGSAAAGVGLLAVKINSLSTEIKDFERFGLSAEKSFGQFKILASDAGLELEDFADLAKDLGVRIGEANLDGEGEVFDIFKKLGLDVKELKGLAPEQQLAKYADAISQVANENERLAITDILLSDAGTKALGVLEKGSAGFSAAAKEAEAFGLNVSAVDAAQLQIAQDAMSRIGLFAEGLFNTIAIEGAPTVAALAELFTDTATELGGVESIAETAFKILNAGIGFALDGWNLFVGGVQVGAGFVVDHIADIISILAEAERAMISVGGQRFDFGVDDIADQAREAAKVLSESGVSQFNEGLSGKASRDFENRLEEIRKRAEEIASEPPAPLPIPEPPQVTRPPVDIGAIANNIWDAVSSAFAGSELASPPELQDRPTVSALSRGSSAAQTFLNSLGQQDVDKEIAQRLEEQKKQEKELMERNIAAIKQVGNLISNAAGVLVPL